MALRGTTQTLTATFYDSPGGVIEDPTSLSLSIFRSGVLVHGPVTQPQVIRDGPGLYRYEYAIPLDAELGTYSAAWTSIQPGDLGPSVGYDTFDVTSVAPGIPDYGGCEWPMDPACMTEEWLALDPDVRQRALRLASSTLVRLSGHRVSNCPIKVRPQPEAGFCGIWTPSSEWGTGYWAARIVNGPRRGARDERSVVLPGPVGRVDEVKVDGAILDPALYHVEGTRLVWHGPDPVPFPRTQDLDKPDTETGTFSVTYLNAYPVDSNAAFAVGILALEFAKACTDNKKCRLPAGVTSIVRQGVAIEIANGTFPNGTTGIREVDAWIGLWNPKGLTHRPMVYSPDLARAVRNPIG